jgi:hypothetical protein
LKSWSEILVVASPREQQVGEPKERAVQVLPQQKRRHVRVHHVHRESSELCHERFRLVPSLRQAVPQALQLYLTFE